MEQDFLEKKAKYRWVQKLLVTLKILVKKFELKPPIFGSTGNIFQLNLDFSLFENADFV